jgi:cytochrome P450
LAGDNLVVSEGEFWLRQRRMAQHPFHHHFATQFALLWRQTSGLPRKSRTSASRRLAATKYVAKPYFPFLGGPHQCIGNEFALVEMRLIVAMVMQAFDFELLPGQAIRPMSTLTIRPSTPIRIRLRMQIKEPRTK